jgi:uncharacterized protein
MTPPCSILIFAKAPQPGEVKTRLIPALGIQGATTLYRQLLRHAITQACRAAVGPVELWCAPDMQDDFFTTCAKEYPLRLHIQQGADLGEKMAHALNDCLSRAPRALLIGSDCPMLDAAYLRQAAKALSTNQSIVISPTEDGGYALIGTATKNLPIFEKIEWSSASVMSQTRQILQAHQLRWLELVQVWDVDTPADLTRLRELPEFALTHSTLEAC